jgi:hypothetical protein
MILGLAAVIVQEQRLSYSFARRMIGTTDSRYDQYDAEYA